MLKDWPSKVATDSQIHTYKNGWICVSEESISTAWLILKLLPLNLGSLAGTSGNAELQCSRAWVPRGLFLFCYPVSCLITLLPVLTPWLKGSTLISLNAWASHPQPILQQRAVQSVKHSVSDLHIRPPEILMKWHSDSVGLRCGHTPQTQQCCWSLNHTLSRRGLEGHAMLLLNALKIIQSLEKTAPWKRLNVTNRLFWALLQKFFNRWGWR